MEGDVLFPELNSAEWEETLRETHPKDAKNDFPFTFIDLKRIKN
ncbi:MAG: dihydrofolate reductase [Bacteroidota bacterium]